MATMNVLSIAFPSTIRLSADARLPQPPSALASLLSWETLENVRELSRTLPEIPSLTSPLPQSVSDAEVERAKRLWMRAHHAFFNHFALLEYCYRSMRENWGENRHDRFEWVRRIALLWRSAGALMMFARDFYPTEAIYQDHIRAAMPPGFSGLWLSERQELHKQKGLFEEFAETATDTDLPLVKAEIKAAHDAYLQYHFQVMHLAAPGKISLAQGYRKEHGRPHPITEEEADIHDRHFKVERSTSVEWIDYADACCEVFLGLIADLQEKHRLSEGVLRDISNGMQTAVDIFCEPQPVHE
jgi:hypothetical protein